MPKIGLIIPVYNAEKTLDVCLKSVDNQTFKDFEVIAVDDGSVDKSLNKLESFKEKTSIKITIFSKANGGAASARKFGLEKLDSEFIAFLDSDDYIDRNYLEKMLNHLEQTKTNICSSRVAFHLNLPIITKISFKNKPRKPVVNLAVDKSFMPMMNVITNGKLFRRGYIDITDKTFQANEDLSKNYYLYVIARNVSFANDVSYHYIPSNSGLVSNYLQGYTWDKIQNTLLPLSDLKSQFISGGLLEEYYSEVEQLFIKNVFQRTDFIARSSLSREEKGILINTLYDFLTFHFPNWRENKYLQTYFREFEIPDMVSAIANKPHIIAYSETMYDSEESIFNTYKSLSKSKK